MRVWIDLANSPHVATFEPVVERFRLEGHEVALTARDHAQTLGLARRAFGDVLVVGGESPGGRARKAVTIAGRARALLRAARRMQPDVALSHGSYAQLAAARVLRVPGVTMMDYEHQPANHVSFRLAARVVVPELFPERALRHFGARPSRVVRYEGFKEELYVGRPPAGRPADEELGLDPDKIVVVMRPAPEGALYHGFPNESFERILADAVARDDVQVVLLPRTADQAARYAGVAGAVVPSAPVDGRSLLRHADVMVGAGGTMNREAAILGTPTYTVFGGRLAAVDAELIRRGLLHDLRAGADGLRFAKKAGRDPAELDRRAEHILGRVRGAVEAAAGGA